MQLRREEGKRGSDDAPVGGLTRKAAADDRAEGQHMTPALPAAADIERCSLGVVEK